MRFVVLAVMGLAAMGAAPAGAASFGAVAGLVEAAREEALGAEAVARRYSYRSRTRSAMRVGRRPHFTRDYRPRMAPPRTRW